MKKRLIGLVLGGVFFIYSVNFSAIKRTLIDFTTFEQNIEKILNKDKEIHDRVIQTRPELDYTQYGFPKVEVKPQDWALSNWLVILTSSAATLRNNVLSYTKPVTSKRFGTVLGARIHFIEGRFLSWALVKPPYNFFSTYEDGSYVTTGPNGEENAKDLVCGVLVNVGQIKSISAWIYGLNYQHSVALRIRDRNNIIREYAFGTTYYDGWRKLIWINSEYTADIKDRILEKLPLYPLSFPTITFDSYIVYKPEVEKGGDYIIYFKDVEVEYDRAYIKEDMDIDDEATWQIISTERLERRVRELRELGEEQTLRKRAIRMQEEASKEAGITK